MSENKIPQTLQHLVYWSVDILGRALKDEFGAKIYNEIEQLRRRMKKVRGLEPEKVHLALRRDSVRIGKMKTQELHHIAHGYSVMLELINRCESAYRVTRLGEREQTEVASRPHAIIFVFTAHPTEARGEAALALFRGIQELLQQVLAGKFKCEEELYHLLRLVLKVPMGKNIKPSVEDEARHIFGTVLRPDILQEQVNLKRRDIIVHFRTWVGGDKDGHPGVDEKTMQRSWQISRVALLEYVRAKMQQMKKQFSLVHAPLADFAQVEKKLRALDHIKKGDGAKVVACISAIKKLAKVYEKKVGVVSPELSDIINLFWLYPALVIPLEIREDSELVHEALKDTRAAISRMLVKLKETSLGHDPKWYVRGFVLSMVMSSDDLIAGHALCRRMLGKYAIPVVPLFENAHALTQAIPILKEYFKQEPTVINHHMKVWSGRFETMVGYSDSSKESGVFPSRWMIRRALVVIDQFLRKQKLTPVFFHGSGGSVERGGGSIKEQTQWWPKSGVDIFKATTQGEMVARNFSSPLILRGQVEKIAAQAANKTSKIETVNERKLLTKFSDLVAARYRATVASDDFFDVVEKATPYHYLDVLKIGSRPTKRQTGADRRKLRAIPWVLCWTQTRLLFPTWWGVGHAWQELSDGERAQMRELYRQNDLLSSFCKSLGFTLAKVELGVWKTYLDYADIDRKTRETVYAGFAHEYELARKFLRELTGETELLWHRPWLGQSIYFRSAMIHPLNLIQLEALKRGDDALLRETVTGVACGMLTTG